MILIALVSHVTVACFSIYRTIDSCCLFLESWLIYGLFRDRNKSFQYKLICSYTYFLFKASGTLKNECFIAMMSEFRSKRNYFCKIFHLMLIREPTLTSTVFFGVVPVTMKHRRWRIGGTCILPKPQVFSIHISTIKLIAFYGSIYLFLWRDRIFSLGLLSKAPPSRSKYTHLLYNFHLSQYL